MTDAQFALTPSFAPGGRDDIDLEAASRLSGLHPDLILEFTRARLVVVRQDEAGEFYFDDQAIYRLRIIERLQRERRAGPRLIRMVMSLLDRAERAERELRRLRERSL